MFYLTAFLAMLIGILIYSLDPITQRQDLDVHQSEGYITNFLTQHQAAKDYLSHWLGRVYPGQVAVDSSNNNQPWFWSNGSNDVNNNALDWNATAIGLSEYQLGELFPNGMSAKMANTNIYDGRLRYNLNNAQNSDLYFSAVVCTNKAYTNAGKVIAADSEPAPCYRPLCSNGTLSDTDTCTDENGNALNIIGVRMNPNAKHYVLTYDIEQRLGVDKASRVQKLQAWRQAFRERTHGTFTCGVAVANYNILSDNNPPQIVQGGWMQVNNSGFNRILPNEQGYRDLIAEDLKDSFNNPIKTATYCLDNGSRCVMLIPPGLEQFLSMVAEGDFNEALVCMSEVEDPYEKIAATKFHFDGIDRNGYGGPEKENDETIVLKNIANTGLNNYWFPVNPPSGRWPSNVFSCADKAQCSTGACLAEVQDVPFSAWRANPQEDFPYIFPIQYSNTDFTLNLVIDFGSGYQAGDVFLQGGRCRKEADENPNALIGVGVVDSNGDRNPNGYETYFSLQPAGDQGDKLALYIQGNENSNVPAVVFENDWFLRGSPNARHAITLVRKSGKMYVFVDGQQVSYDFNTAFEAGNVAGPSQGGSPNYLRFPVGNNNAQKYELLDVRYYGRALDARAIHKNFMLDLKRYAISPAEDTGSGARLLDIQNRGIY